MVLAAMPRAVTWYLVTGIAGNPLGQLMPILIILGWLIVLGCFFYLAADAGRNRLHGTTREKGRSQGKFKSLKSTIIMMKAREMGARIAMA